MIIPDIRSILCWILLAAAVTFGITSCAEHEMLKGVRAALKSTQDALKTTADRITTQKKEAAAELRTATASTLALQNRLDADHIQQEKYDAADTKTLAQLRIDLARMRAAARSVLYAADSAGRGGGGSGPESQSAAATVGGSPGSSEADGVLHVPKDAEAAADDDALAADTINNAYASCRADALSLRQLNE